MTKVSGGKSDSNSLEDLEWV